MSEATLKVVLLRHTPNPEETVAMAAKLCYSPANIGALLEKIEANDQTAFVEKLASIGHLSPIEHVSFTFGVEGISRACSHQLVRHRVASFSQQSQRYVREEQFDYLLPPSIAAVPILAERFRYCMDSFQRGAPLSIPLDFMVGRGFMTLHIVPVNDLREHEEATTCWCLPRIEWHEEALVIHNSADGRELTESLRRPQNDQM